MSDGPKRYQTDPNLPFTSDEIRRLEAAHSVPPADIAEKMADAFFGPQADQNEITTCVMCPLCKGAGMVTPKVACEYGLAVLPPLDAPELDEE